MKYKWGYKIDGIVLQNDFSAFIQIRSFALLALLFWDLNNSDKFTRISK